MGGNDRRVSEPARYHTSIREWPKGEQPREKLMAGGPQALSDSELLAILIRTGAGRITAVDLGTTLMREFISLSRLATRSFQELKQYKGLGEAKSIALVAAFELGRRAAAAAPERTVISSPEDVVARFAPLLRDRQTEQFSVLLLDSANHCIREVTISTGILNSSLVHPREVFRPAILEPAASIILLHNHPSGNPEPSTEDLQVTRQLADAARILGIPVHDHIIVAGDRYVSFAEKGLL